MKRDAGTHTTGLLALVLLGLLAGSGALQLHWVDAWSRGEEARLRRFVESGAGRVAVDLERALGQLEEPFLEAARARDADLGAALLAAARRTDGPLTAKRVIWLDPHRPEAPFAVDPSAKRVTPIAWDTLGAWEPAARALVAGASQDRRSAAPLSPTHRPEPIHVPADPPGLVVPLLPAGGGRLHVVLLLLDPAQLATGWLAARVDEHLVDAFEDQLRVVVTLGDTLVHASHEGRTPSDLEPADATLALGGGETHITRRADGRLEIEQRGSDEDSLRVIEVEATTTTEPIAFDDGSDAPSATVERAPLVLRFPSWRVRARHADGSIAAAVASLRRRQLALGLGLLVLLAAAAGLLLVSARRANALARRQVEFVAGVTHELRTPLTVIRSAAENLRDRVVTEPGQARRYGGLIHDEARRLTDFVEHALSLAGARSPSAAAARSAPFELAPVIQRAVARRGLPDGAPPVEVELAADLPPVLADANAVEQALDNLLANALKYGGDPPRVGVRVAAGDGRVEVTVWDRGPGIPRDERAQLFEPFFRGRTARASQAPGSGLGLAVVRRVVEAQGGTVSVASDEGTGTSFTLHLRASA